jgi:bifunctional polynucleotide phosphatase/kinase
MDGVTLDNCGFHPSKYLASAAELPVVEIKQGMVILVGRPASGKSFHAQQHLIPHGYVHINQDTLKSKDKCLKLCREALELGKSVVVDNTNPNQSARKPYIELAKMFEVDVQCLHFDTEEALAKHNNAYRALTTNTPLIPSIVYRMYASNFQAPRIEEGFSHVHTISFCPQFTPDQVRAWSQWYN